MSQAQPPIYFLLTKIENRDSSIISNVMGNTCENHFGYIPNGTQPTLDVGPIYPGTDTPDKEVYGVKQLSECREDYVSAEQHGRVPRTFQKCWAGVVVSGTVIRSMYDVNSPSDLRASQIMILRMWADDGTECNSGKSQIYGFNYRVGVSYVTHCDRDVTRAIAPGFHIWPSRHAGGPKRSMG